MSEINETYLIKENLLRKMDEILHDLEEFPRHDMAIGAAIWYLRLAKNHLTENKQPTKEDYPRHSWD